MPDTDLSPMERAVRSLSQWWRDHGELPGEDDPFNDIGDLVIDALIALRMTDEAAWCAAAGLEEGHAALGGQVVELERWSRYCQTEELLTRDKPWEDCTAHVTFALYRVKQHTEEPEPGDITCASCPLPVTLLDGQWRHIVKLDGQQFVDLYRAFSDHDALPGKQHTEGEGG